MKYKGDFIGKNCIVNCLYYEKVKTMKDQNSPNDAEYQKIPQLTLTNQQFNFINKYL